MAVEQVAMLRAQDTSNPEGIFGLWPVRTVALVIDGTRVAAFPGAPWIQMTPAELRTYMDTHRASYEASIDSTPRDQSTVVATLQGTVGGVLVEMDLEGVVGGPLLISNVRRLP